MTITSGKSSNITAHGLSRGLQAGIVIHIFRISFVNFVFLGNKICWLMKLLNQEV